MLQLPCCVRTVRSLALLSLVFATAGAKLAAQGAAYLANFETAAGYTSGPMVTQGRWTVGPGSATIIGSDKVSGA